MADDDFWGGSDTKADDANGGGGDAAQKLPQGDGDGDGDGDDAEGGGDDKNKFAKQLKKEQARKEKKDKAKEREKERSEAEIVSLQKSIQQREEREKQHNALKGKADRNQKAKEDKKKAATKDVEDVHFNPLSAKRSKPRAATSAFKFYSDDNKSSALGQTEMFEEWKKLSEDKKKPYVDKAEEDKKRYNKEMDQWKAIQDSLKKAKGAGAKMQKKDKGGKKEKRHKKKGSDDEEEATKGDEDD